MATCRPIASAIGCMNVCGTPSCSPMMSGHDPPTPILANAAAKCSAHCADSSASAVASCCPGQASGRSPDEGSPVSMCTLYVATRTVVVLAIVGWGDGRRGWGEGGRLGGEGSVGSEQCTYGRRRSPLLPEATCLSCLCPGVLPVHTQQLCQTDQRVWLCMRMLAAWYLFDLKFMFIR